LAKIIGFANPDVSPEKADNDLRRARVQDDLRKTGVIQTDAELSLRLTAENDEEVLEFLYSKGKLDRPGISLADDLTAGERISNLPQRGQPKSLKALGLRGIKE
jgi:hypothetical protein